MLPVAVVRVRSEVEGVDSKAVDCNSSQDMHSAAGVVIVEEAVVVAVLEVAQD
jgi:hypothetical protein